MHLTFLEAFASFPLVFFVYKFQMIPDDSRCRKDEPFKEALVNLGSHRFQSEVMAPVIPWAGLAWGQSARPLRCGMPELVLGTGDWWD